MHFCAFSNSLNQSTKKKKKREKLKVAFFKISQLLWEELLSFKLRHHLTSGNGLVQEMLREPTSSAGQGSLSWTAPREAVLPCKGFLFLLPIQRKQIPPQLLMAFGGRKRHGCPLPSSPAPWLLCGLPTCLQIKPLFRSCSKS